MQTSNAIVQETTRSPFASWDDVSLDIDLASQYNQFSYDDLTSLTKPTDLIGSSINIPPMDLPGRHNAETIAYMTDRIRSWPTSFVYQSKTPFMHPLSYNTPSKMPQVLQDAFAVCAVYLTLTPLNRNVIFGIIEAKVADIIGHDCDMKASVAENLAALQALVLVQIVQLFDGGT